jgi:hypothetical protein
MDSQAEGIDLSGQVAILAAGGREKLRGLPDSGRQDSP